MEKIKKFIAKNLEDIVSLDLRALAFFRIFLGSVMLIDMLDRLKDVNIFYVDGGVGVGSSVSRLFINDSFSLNNLFPTSPAFQAFILILGVVFAVLLIFGFKTRISTILLWIIVVSVQNRNTIIGQGGDDYMRVLLFWSMLLPLGLRYSYDYLRNRTEYNKYENKFVSPVNIGLIFQVVYLYYFSALSKSSPIWNRDFTAIYYALSLDIFVTWLGRILLTLRPLLKPLTAFVYYLELYAGGLLIFPAYNWILRTIGILLIIMLHMGIGTTLDVGPFPWIAICGVLSLMPTQAIDLAIKKLSKSKKIMWFIYSLKISTLKGKLAKLFPEKVSKIKKVRNFNTLTIFGTLLISIITFSFTFVGYIWNSNNNKSNFELPSDVRKVFTFVRMDQRWAMFAPYPFTDDGWYVILGHTVSGKTESLFGSSVKTDFNGFPDNYSQDFKNE
ncbi:MAG: hypothetical protein ACMG57_03880, partial [Candidatus Dojkabacteria bacterium]